MNHRRRRIFYLAYFDLVTIKLFDLLSVFFNSKIVNKRGSDGSDEDEGGLEHFVGGHHNHQDHHRLQDPVHQVEPDRDKVLLPPSLHSLIREARCYFVLFLCEHVSEAVQQWDADVATEQDNEVEDDSERVYGRHVKVVTALVSLISEVHVVVIELVLSTSAY